MNEVKPGHKYFDWGYSESELYALYSPVLDKIMFLCNNLDHAISLGLLISSRIHLVPIRIDQSINYSKELIDNSCCFFKTLDTLESIKKLNYPYFRMFKHDIVNYKNKIVESSGNISDKIVNIRNFLFLGNWTLEQFDDVDFALKYSQELLPILPDGIFHSYYRTKKKCLGKIYLEEDFDKICDFIENEVKYNSIRYDPSNIFSVE